MTWVWDNAPDVNGSELLVLLAIADEAGSDGRNAYPGVTTLKERSRISERQVRRILKNLRDRGVIRDDGIAPAPYYTTRYSIVGMQGGDNLSPDIQGTGEANEANDRPSIGHPAAIQRPSIGHSCVTQPVPVPEPQRDYSVVSLVKDDEGTFSEETLVTYFDECAEGCDLPHRFDELCEDRNGNYLPRPSEPIAVAA